MGMAYSPVLMYGRYFEEREALIEYVQHYYPNAEPADEFFEDEPKLEGINFICLNLWSGDGFLLGIHVPVGEVIDQYKADWDAVFPDEDGELYHEVQKY